MQSNQAAGCDNVPVRLDNATLERREMWEASDVDIQIRLASLRSKARERGAFGVREFKRLAVKVWSAA
ncbi:hypothetical protein PY650_21885 [Rhizobium calliandrae]|uniref:Uncharacterized protein n=1 Tax=Rhizobium calliandrae TaxID=1312182 RepID=A0ABT7KI59_9HYPH|nr:hypothetical protein [Rhizobium calliandrae]MDL2408247.1 hypothetical protein [Rhizobium calliandrae]